MSVEGREDSAGVRYVYVRGVVKSACSQGREGRFFFIRLGQKGLIDGCEFL